MIVCEPLLEAINLSAYLSSSIEQVVAGGESGFTARTCDYSWILRLRQQCQSAGVPFHFKQTGTYFRKYGKTYRIKRSLQHQQASKAGIDLL